MVGLAPLLITFILASSVSYTVYKNNQIDFNVDVEEVKDSNIKVIVESSIELVKASISDGEFESNQVFYINNQNLGYKYLQNKSLNKVIKDFDFDNGTISVGYKLDGNYISTIIQSNKYGKELFMVVKFSINILNNLPLAYSGSGGMSNGSMCSVQYNGTNNYGNSDKVNPNFNIFMDGGFKVSGTAFEIPSNANNIKKIAIHSNNGSGSISGYKEIDEYYNMNDVSITNQAIVGKVEVGGTAYIDKSSSVGELIQNSNYQYPSFNTSFKDNDIANSSKNLDGSNKESITCGIGACNELNTSTCILPTNPYSYNWYNNNNYYAWNYGFNDATKKNDCNQYSNQYKNNICKDAYQEKKDYNTCQSTYIPSSCIDSTIVSLPEGDYDKLIIGNGCNLDLTDSIYTFTDVLVKDTGAINFTNQNVELKANNIDVVSGAKINYDGINDDSYMIISSNNISLSENGSMNCIDPRKCLIDTNIYNAETGSTAIGNILARTKMNIYGGYVYGNLIAEEMDISNTQICNVLNENNSQMMSKGYYNINSNSTLNTVIEGRIIQAMCSSLGDCYNKLSN